MGTEHDADHELIEAAGRGDIDRASQLLDAGANPNARHLLYRATPVMVAASKGHLDMVKLLVRSGADATLVAGDAPQLPIESAAIAGRRDVVAWLLEAGATLPEGEAGDQLIAEVTEAGETEVAELLRKARKPKGR